MGADLHDLLDDRTMTGAFLRHLTRVLDSHYARLHAALSDSWSDVDERRFVDSATTLTLQPQTENAFRVDHVLAVAGCAAGQFMMLELGSGDGHKIVVPPNPAAGPGFALLDTDCAIRLTNTDQRVLSIVTATGSTVPGLRGSGTAGFLYLALMGKEIPPGAVRW